MNDKDEKTILRIIYYCDKIDSHIDYFGDDRELFLENEHYQDACALVIIQIGEFVSRLSDEFINEHSEIPWTDIKKMRNVHAHNYDNVMFDTLWVTMKRDVPELREYLQNLI